jgi:hypothetical protein
MLARRSRCAEPRPGRSPARRGGPASRSRRRPGADCETNPIGAACGAIPSEAVRPTERPLLDDHTEPPIRSPAPAPSGPRPPERKESPPGPHSGPTAERTEGPAPILCQAIAKRTEFVATYRHQMPYDVPAPAIGLVIPGWPGPQQPLDSTRAGRRPTVHCETNRIRHKASCDKRIRGWPGPRQSPNSTRAGRRPTMHCETNRIRHKAPCDKPIRGCPGLAHKRLSPGRLPAVPGAPRGRGRVSVVEAGKDPSGRLTGTREATG